MKVVIRDASDCVIYAIEVNLQASLERRASQSDAVLEVTMRGRARKKNAELHRLRSLGFAENTTHQLQQVGRLVGFADEAVHFYRRVQDDLRASRAAKEDTF